MAEYSVYMFKLDVVRGAYISVRCNIVPLSISSCTARPDAAITSDPILNKLYQRIIYTRRSILLRLTRFFGEYDTPGRVLTRISRPRCLRFFTCDLYLPLLSQFTVWRSQSLALSQQFVFMILISRFLLLARVVMLIKHSRYHGSVTGPSKCEVKNVENALSSKCRRHSRRRYEKTEV